MSIDINESHDEDNKKSKSVTNKNDLKQASVDAVMNTIITMGLSVSDVLSNDNK